MFDVVVLHLDQFFADNYTKVWFTRIVRGLKNRCVAVHCQILIVNKYRSNYC